MREFKVLYSPGNKPCRGWSEPVTLTSLSSDEVDGLSPRQNDVVEPNWLDLQILYIFTNYRLLMVFLLPHSFWLYVNYRASHHGTYTASTMCDITRIVLFG